MPLCVHCPTVRTLLMSLMCSCWQEMFIFSSLADQHAEVIYSSSESLAWFVMFPPCASSASHTLFTFSLNVLCCWWNFAFQLRLEDTSSAALQTADWQSESHRGTWGLRWEIYVVSTFLPFHDTTQHLSSEEILLKPVLKAFPCQSLGSEGFSHFAFCACESPLKLPALCNHTESAYV